MMFLVSNWQPLQYCTCSMNNNNDAFNIKLAASAVLYLFYDYNNNDAFSIKLAASAVLYLFYE